MNKREVIGLVTGLSLISLSGCTFNPASMNETLKYAPIADVEEEQNTDYNAEEDEQIDKYGVFPGEEEIDDEDETVTESDSKEDESYKPKEDVVVLDYGILPDDDIAFNPEDEIMTLKYGAVAIPEEEN